MIDNSKEYILCSAILRKEEKSETNLHNVDVHKCELGLRHCDIMCRFSGELKTSPSSQGFLTSKGRFVNRKDAEVIARNCGQLVGNIIGGELTSEDLW